MRKIMAVISMYHVNRNLYEKTEQNCPTVIATTYDWGKQKIRSLFVGQIFYANPRRAISKSKYRRDRVTLSTAPIPE